MVRQVLPAGVAAWRDERAAGETGIVIEQGTLADYDALAPLHYRAGRPATIARVLRATDPRSGLLAGVLVVSMPTLNGAWRRLAWGARFASGDRKRDAAAVNAQLRTISRVIVEPRFRGLRVGTVLVASYLSDADTRCTEAISALGDTCPFFERAGMRKIGASTPKRDLSLARAVGVSTPQAAAARLLEPDGPRSFETPLRRWARQSASTRRHADGPIEILASLAAGALLAPPIAYAHGSLG
ncbi:MAG: hypothetical protein AAFR96_03805 [Planctomycetota bacterium]